jgi:hypothetical protein
MCGRQLCHVVTTFLMFHTYMEEPLQTIIGPTTRAMRTRRCRVIMLRRKVITTSRSRRSIMSTYTAAKVDSLANSSSSSSSSSSSRSRSSRSRTPRNMVIANKCRGTILGTTIKLASGCPTKISFSEASLEWRSCLCL